MLWDFHATKLVNIGGFFAEAVIDVTEMMGRSLFLRDYHPLNGGLTKSFILSLDIN